MTLLVPCVRALSMLFEDAIYADHYQPMDMNGRKGDHFSSIARM